MATFKESAGTYEAPQTLNIADLDKVQVDIEVFDGQGKDSNGEEFKYKFAKIEGKEYRIPGPVLGGLKAILEKKPDLKAFSVSKQGQGINTRYTVIPMD